MQNININDVFSDKNRVPVSQDITSFISKDNQKNKEVATVDAPLRDINIDRPTYGRKEIKTAADELTSRLATGQSGLELKNSMVLAASNMTKQDFSKMKSDGFSPEELDEAGIVTVADKIRMNLAKGGMDVSKIGGISDEALSEIAGSASGKAALERAMDDAAKKASEISAITDDTKHYLIKNDLEPTIENVHKANFSVSAKYEYSENPAGGGPLSEEDLNALKPQIDEVIKKAGYPVSDTARDSARWILERDLPLTEDSLGKLIELSENEPALDENSVKIAIADAVYENKQPKDALVVSGQSAREVALRVTGELSSITDVQIENAVKKNDPMTLASISSQEKEPIDNYDLKDDKKSEYEYVSARRNLEEIRLSMTLEVSYSMSMRGIKVDTTALSDLVSELKAREERLYESIFGKGATSEQIEVYTETNVTVSSLMDAPAAALGRFASVSEITLRNLNQEANSVAAKFVSAGETYEALMTAPRKDMGDSIKKAFRNVDDILEDLGFETSDENRRAVRILGYNSIPITGESLVSMRDADSQMQRTFRNLTPGVVAKMVKEGVNPLDLSLDELNKKIDEIKNRYEDTRDEEDYAEFLYKLDRQKALSDEERNSFVGIYRLMHQVVQSDGAVIGALINQGAEITMRNMMLAIRTDKHKNREAVIDDSFGGISGFKKESLSITDQIQMAFMTTRTADAKDAITPGKLASFEGDSYMDMNPDQLASRLEAIPENPEDEDAFVMEQLDELRRSVETETKVYDALKQFDLPVSPANLQAMNAFLADRNGVYRKVFSQTVSDEDLEKTPRELMADIIRRFGEAVKSPEDMADAQQKLAETAENVMRNMMVEENVGSIDIRGMKVAIKQVKMLGQVGKQAENYTIPIMVADEAGTLNLRVVRGKSDNNGLVDIAFNMDKTGPVEASFTYSAQGVSGTISAVSDAVISAIKDMEEDLTEAMSQAVDARVSIEYEGNASITEDSIYEDKKPGFETADAIEEKSRIATQRLYGMARAFIDTLSKITI